MIYEEQGYLFNGIEGFGGFLDEVQRILKDNGAILDI